MASSPPERRAQSMEARVRTLRRRAERSTAGRAAAAGEASESGEWAERSTAGRAAATGEASESGERAERSEAMIPFAKGHGLGNDYIVINEVDLPGPLAMRQIERICDRNWGAGSDGILLLVPAWDGADFGLRILNPDGSEAEKSGNGLRIFAKYLWDHGHDKREVFTVATKGGRVECRCHVVDGRMNLVAVEMGRCTFVPAEIPMTDLAGEALRVPLDVDGERLIVTAVSVGNPHCVIFTDRLD